MQLLDKQAGGLQSSSIFAFGPHVLIASLVANLLAFALPLFLLQIYDRIIPRQAFETLTVLMIGVVVAIICELILRTSRSHLMGLAGEAFERRALSAVFDRFLNGDLKILEKDAPGVHLDHVGSLDQIRDFRSGEAATVKLDLIFACLFLFVIGMISLTLAIIVFMLTAASLIVVRLLHASADELSERKHQVDRRRYSFLIEVLKGVELVKSFNIEAFMERRYERLMGSTAAIGAIAYEKANFAQSVTGAIGQITPVVIAGVGALQVINNTMTVGGLAACLLLGSRIVQPALKLASLEVGEEDVKRAEREIRQILDLPSAKAGTMPCRSIETIELRDVSMSYEGEAESLFRNLDFRITKGEVVAVNGANGSGKSSFLWLMTGYLQPDSGHVLVNGSDIREIDPHMFRGKVAYLPQQPRLLEGTVLENMTRFQPELHTEDALEIANALGLLDYFSMHPHGINLKVGLGGEAGLPTAVAERIPLVGALVGKPDLILFDETNANLDLEGDYRLRTYLEHKKGEAAIVLVSQRPSYIRMADRKYQLSSGGLAPTGVNEHEDLQLSVGQQVV